MSVDPLAEKYSFQNPYAYAANNPVTMKDILGLEPGGPNDPPKKNKTEFSSKPPAVFEFLGRNMAKVVNGVASLAEKIKNAFSDYEVPKERDAGQHKSENWNLYGNGSASGWTVPAPKANPDGESKHIDISDMYFTGKGMGSKFLKRTVDVTKNLGKINNLLKSTEKIKKINRIVGGNKSNFNNDRVNSLMDRINSSRQAIDSICNSCDRKPHGLPYRRIGSNGNVIDTIKNR